MKSLLMKMQDLQGIWYHIIGLICLIWFLIRVVPAPHRSQYPCQQVAIPIALGYLAFWSLLFHGLIRWLRHVKTKTAGFLPTIVVSMIILFTVSSMVYAQTSNNSDASLDSWMPTPLSPIGDPQGVYPGRVVWIWDPHATESTLQGYWWKQENNNQDVIDEMISTGIQNLTGTSDDETAWDMLFIDFNMNHNNGERGYQLGEKIAIKINLNNCWELWKNPYLERDNERDASPYVVKALLRHLIDIVGVAQEDITVFDASRSMGNWFYNRVYYESFPAFSLIAEFPEVNFVDAEGGAFGRQKVVASNEKIYFADGTGFSRTLPTCVVDAQYLINMPLLKKHPIENGVTLSGKNLFGVFIEPVDEIHPYHEAAHVLGNPAPQVDLLGHEQLGGKTLLYLADGMFGTVEDHRKIAQFHMYPFNNDWTNSLFFSQDPVALDSVLYDFLYSEGTNPCEGSQNYLHQAAEPPVNVYDPENDGIFLSGSLGIHEHWDTSVDIFSSERYSGSEGTGIDFVAIGEEHANPMVLITQPEENMLYISGQSISSFLGTVVVGTIDVTVIVNGIYDDVKHVEFFLDDELVFTDYQEPFSWTWDTFSFRRHTVEATAYFGDDDALSHKMHVWKYL